MKVKLDNWDSHCGDGCCYTYGTTVRIEDDMGIEVDRFEENELVDEHYTLKRVLSKVAPNVEIVINEENN